MKRLIVIVGAGSIGRRHASNLSRLGGYEIALVDPRRDFAETLAEEVAGRTFGSLENALSSAPSGVMICSPPSFHVDQATAALESGAKVFVEKPIATHSGPDLSKLLSLVEQSGDSLMVGFNLRFNRCIRKAKDLVNSGELGTLQCIEASFGQDLTAWRPGADYRQGYMTGSPKLGGGVIHDIASHEIDYITWIGGDVTEIGCLADRVSSLDMAAEDTAEIFMRFASGAIGRVHADCVRPGYMRRFEITGSSGILSWDFHTGLKLTNGEFSNTVSVEPPADPREAYVLELQHFLSMIETGIYPEVSAQSAHKVLTLVEAAHASARNRTVSAVR